jgi:signal transduction histidine kinase
LAVPAAPEQASRDRRLSRLVGRDSWLNRHRQTALVLMAAAIAGALVLDVAIPSYPIAGFYLVPVTIAALTLRVRMTMVVSALCLVLAVYVAVVQGRTDGPTITVLCFTVLGGAGLIALAYLFKRVDEMYETERATTERLESLAAQLQTLQEVAVLDPDLPLSDLLARVIEQAGQLLDSDGCSLYRLDRESGELLVAASAGDVAGAGDVHQTPPAGSASLVRALEDRRTVAVSGLGAGDGRNSATAPALPAGATAAGRGALLAVPLLVRDDPYGVLALFYRRPRAFSDVDVLLAASFGGQVALAIENARLRDEVEQNAAASERSRLARDLHDSVTQSLFAASLKAEAVRRRWQPASEEARQNVEDVERLARGALAEMRALLLEMRPQALEGAALPALLEQLVAAAEGRLPLDVELTVSGAGTLPPDVTVALYRIAQEAVNNVERHARATTAWVRLEYTPEGVRLDVGDDGHGFAASQVKPGHLGLDIMRERAAAAGVRLSVDGGDGRGAVVTAEWDGGDPEGEGRAG